MGFLRSPDIPGFWFQGRALASLQAAATCTGTGIFYSLVLVKSWASRQNFDRSTFSQRKENLVVQVCMSGFGQSIQTIYALYSFALVGGEVPRSPE